MASTLSKLLGSIPRLVQEFASVLQASPEQAVLLICGAILVLFSVAVFGYLTLGAFLRPVGSLLTPRRGKQY